MKNIVLLPETGNRDMTQENALSAHLTTVILSVRPQLAMMITNAISGVRCDTWLIFERHMTEREGNVYTTFCFADSRVHQTDAINTAVAYAKAIFGVDIDTSKTPF